MKPYGFRKGDWKQDADLGSATKWQKMWSSTRQRRKSATRQLKFPLRKPEFNAHNFTATRKRIKGRQILRGRARADAKRDLQTRVND